MALLTKASRGVTSTRPPTHPEKDRPTALVHSPTRETGTNVSGKTCTTCRSAHLDNRCEIRTEKESSEFKSPCVEGATPQHGVQKSRLTDLERCWRSKHVKGHGPISTFRPLSRSNVGSRGSSSSTTDGLRLRSSNSIDILRAGHIPITTRRFVLSRPSGTT
jgi:hypothetical protein